MPVVALAPQDPWHEKMISQIRAGQSTRRQRGGRRHRRRRIASKKWPTMCCGCRTAPWLLSPVLTVIPLQMLAYHIAAPCAGWTSISRGIWRRV
jgi:glutamine---fructose-6-phosphate transaminase (isomerizing)